jgi:site-specific recombinase XerD
MISESTRRPVTGHNAVHPLGRVGRQRPGRDVGCHVASDQVDRAVRARRKGALAAYRDTTLFKVIYAWGLRRTETSLLDVADWGRNPAAPEFGRHGMLHVRYGKAKRGQPPRRRNVASVMGWAVEAVADYVENIRPKFGCDGHPALWLTERGGRVRPPEINARFEAYRDALACRGLRCTR